MIHTSARARARFTAALLPVAASLGLLTVAGCRSTPVGERPATAARDLLLQGMHDLSGSLVALDSTLLTGSTDRQQVAFRGARRAYKRVEALLVYFVPVETALLNGPLMQDDDADSPLPRATPVVFQLVEIAAFEDSTARDSAWAAVAGMLIAADRLTGLLASTPIEQRAVIDAARVGVGRVVALGLAGFDTGASGDAVVEAAESLEGIRLSVRTLDGPAEPLAHVDAALAAAVAELRAHPDFETLDRLRFISQFANPVWQALDEARQSIGLPAPGIRRAWQASAAGLFDRDAFDPAAFAPAHARTGSPDLVALGEKLFFEARLSGPSNRSCGFCHIPGRAFTDGRARAEPLHGLTTTLRNTPTLINAALQATLFADDRARSLENQVTFVLGSAPEMGSSADAAAARLQADSTYRAAFARAMPDRSGQPITGLEVQQAVAAYMRTLVALDSRFDRAARGDTMALTAEEQAGFTVFMGKGRCGTCHFIPLFNGVMPPDYASAEPEIIGVPSGPDLAHARLDPDLGRAGVEGVPINRFAFKVPTLRNIALTAPYMHNGVFANLEQVVEFYDKGGGAGLGMNLPSQTLPAVALKLTPKEKSDLIAFMRALTDTVVRR